MGWRGWSEFPSQIWRGLSFLGVLVLQIWDGEGGGGLSLLVRFGGSELSRCLSFPDLGRGGGRWSEFASQIWKGLSFLGVFVFQIWGGKGGGGLSLLVRFRGV